MILPSDGFTVDFIGPIPEENKIKSTLINYHGQLSTESDIRHILAGADVLVCPSYAEGMPNVIMEAMACGLAIIATDVGAVSLLVNGDNGWLINYPDPKEISKIMSSIIGDKPEMLRQKKINSYQKIKSFTVERVNSLLIHHIEESMKKVSLL
jgi:glycosyltransferase involved in cell wall biosynthesis